MGISSCSVSPTWVFPAGHNNLYCNDCSRNPLESQGWQGVFPHENTRFLGLLFQQKHNISPEFPVTTKRSSHPLKQAGASTFYWIRMSFFRRRRLVSSPSSVCTTATMGMKKMMPSTPISLPPINAPTRIQRGGNPTELPTT